MRAYGLRLTLRAAMPTLPQRAVRMSIAELCHSPPLMCGVSVPFHVKYSCSASCSGPASGENSTYSTQRQSVADGFAGP